VELPKNKLFTSTASLLKKQQLCLQADECIAPQETTSLLLSLPSGTIYGCSDFDTDFERMNTLRASKQPGYGRHGGSNRPCVRHFVARSLMNTGTV
jgi:hypothetical protein